MRIIHVHPKVKNIKEMKGNKNFEKKKKRQKIVLIEEKVNIQTMVIPNRVQHLIQG